MRRADASARPAPEASGRLGLCSRCCAGAGARRYWCDLGGDAVLAERMRAFSASRAAVRAASRAADRRARRHDRGCRRLGRTSPARPLRHHRSARCSVARARRVRGSGVRARPRERRAAARRRDFCARPSARARGMHAAERARGRVRGGATGAPPPARRARTRRAADGSRFRRSLEPRCASPARRPGDSRGRRRLAAALLRGARGGATDAGVGARDARAASATRWPYAAAAASGAARVAQRGRTPRRRGCGWRLRRAHEPRARGRGRADARRRTAVGGRPRLSAGAGAASRSSSVRRRAARRRRRHRARRGRGSPRRASRPAADRASTMACGSARGVAAAVAPSRRIDELATPPASARGRRRAAQSDPSRWRRRQRSKLRAPRSSPSGGARAAALGDRPGGGGPRAAHCRAPAVDEPVHHHVARRASICAPPRAACSPAPTGGRVLRRGARGVLTILGFRTFSRVRVVGV